MATSLSNRSGARPWVRHGLAYDGEARHLVNQIDLVMLFDRQ
jgi:hypothetical protein